MHTHTRTHTYTHAHTHKRTHTNAHTGIHTHALVTTQLLSSDAGSTDVAQSTHAANA